MRGKVNISSWLLCLSLHLPTKAQSSSTSCSCRKYQRPPHGKSQEILFGREASPKYLKLNYRNYDGGCCTCPLSMSIVKTTHDIMVIPRVVNHNGCYRFQHLMTALSMTNSATLYLRLTASVIQSTISHVKSFLK